MDQSVGSGEAAQQMMRRKILFGSKLDLRKESKLVMQCARRLSAGRVFETKNIVCLHRLYSLVHRVCLWNHSCTEAVGGAYCAK